MEDNITQLHKPKVMLTARMSGSSSFVKKLRDAGIDVVTEGYMLVDGLFYPVKKDGTPFTFLPPIPYLPESRFVSQEIAPELVKLMQSDNITVEDGMQNVVFDAEDSDGFVTFGKKMTDILSKLKNDNIHRVPESKAYFTVHEPQQSEKGWHVRMKSEFFTEHNIFYSAFSDAGWDREKIIGFVLRHEFSHAFMFRREHLGQETFGIPGSEETNLLGTLIKAVERQGIHSESKTIQQFALFMNKVFSEGYADCRAITLMPDLPDALLETIPILRKFLCDATGSSSHETWRAVNHLITHMTDASGHEQAAQAASVGVFAFMIDCIKHSDEIRNFVLDVAQHDPGLNRGFSLYHLGNRGRTTRLTDAGFDEPPNDTPSRILGNLLSIAKKSGVVDLPRAKELLLNGSNHVGRKRKLALS